MQEEAAALIAGLAAQANAVVPLVVADLHTYFSAGISRLVCDDPFEGSGSATGQALTSLRADSAVW